MLGSTLFSFIQSSLPNISIRHCSELIPNLSIPQRKALLTIVQTAVSIGDKPRYDEPLEKLLQCWITLDGIEHRVNRIDINSAVETIRYSPVYRSFISMLLRAESYLVPSGFEEVLKERVLNELTCSQREKPRCGVNYECLDPDKRSPAWYNPRFAPKPRWVASARAFASSVANRLQRMGILYPKIQRRKNVSRNTARLIIERGYRHNHPNWTEITTLDLELHKVRTGEEIGGDCELRYAWRYNDLQPRAYYCMGGSLYWRSRYMKPIAVAFMESWPSCRMSKRRDPTLVSYDLEDDDYLALWDMSTFTTDLSELKYFLYYVSRYVEDDLRCRQNPLRLLDYADGIQTVMIHDLIDSYNEAVNWMSLYQILRISDEVLGIECDESLVQKNSGMLGVPGNIGFSTCFHAFHAGYAAKEPDAGVGVGDDAMVPVKDHPSETLVPHMQLIGTLHPEKVDIFFPRVEEIDIQISKFLKRRFTLSDSGLSIDILPSFPNLAPVFGIKDEFHTVHFGDRSEIIMKFLGQVASFLWTLPSLMQFYDEDTELIQRIFCLAYRRLGLPFNGRLPGFKHDAFAERVPLCIPPLFYDYSEDWSEVLWNRSDQKIFVGPLQIGQTFPPEFTFVGECFVASDSRFLQAMIDIGCIKKLRSLREEFLVEESNKRVFQNLIRGQSIDSFVCQYSDTPPSWVSDVLQTDITFVQTDVNRPML